MTNPVLVEVSRGPHGWSGGQSGKIRGDFPEGLCATDERWRDAGAAQDDGLSVNDEGVGQVAGRSVGGVVMRPNQLMHSAREDVLQLNADIRRSWRNHISSLLRRGGCRTA